MMRRFDWLTGAALIASLGGCGRTPAAPEARQQEPARAVTLTRVAERAVGGRFQSSGVLVAREEASVGSELSGYRVAAVYVDEGDRVRAGQPLARLDDTLLRARIRQAAASVAQARAQAAQASGEAARVAGLDGQGVLADEQIQQRRSQASTNAAAVGVAQAQLDDLRTQATRMVIRAPVGGVVLQRTLQPGAIAATGGEPLFRIVRDELVELDAEVPEAMLASLHIGGPATVTLPSGTSLAGRIRFVSPRVDPDTRLGHARVQLPVHRELRPGGYARVAFDLPVAPRPAVPERAVQYEAEGPQIVVAQPNGTARRVGVTLGTHAGGWVTLTKGPPVGTPVVLGGSYLLDGDRIAVAARRER